jgi:hypothetical protein
MRNFMTPIFCVLFFFQAIFLHGDESFAKSALTYQYELHAQQPSDIYEHLPVLRQLAKECSSVVEIGLRTIISTWGILQGLSENPSSTRSYLGIDIDAPPYQTLFLAKRLAETNGIEFDFWQANDMKIDIEPVEMLFIDSLHTYCHLTYELEKFSPKVKKYIVMHDTSDPWGSRDQPYLGDYSEYPPEYNRKSQGLWPAVEDFLQRHPEWTLHQRRLNNHGLTTLRRIK